MLKCALDYFGDVVLSNNCNGLVEMRRAGSFDKAAPARDSALGHSSFAHAATPGRGMSLVLVPARACSSSRSRRLRFGWAKLWSSRARGAWALANTSSFPAAESTAQLHASRRNTHTHTLETVITSACRHGEREKPKSGRSHKHQSLRHVCASLHVMCHLLLEERALRRAKHGVAGRLVDLIVEGLEGAALRGPRPPVSAGGGRGASAAKVPLQQLHCPSQLLGRCAAGGGGGGSPLRRPTFLRMRQLMSHAGFPAGGPIRRLTRGRFATRGGVHLPHRERGLTWYVLSRFFLSATSYQIGLCLGLRVCACEGHIPRPCSSVWRSGSGRGEPTPTRPRPQTWRAPPSRSKRPGRWTPETMENVHHHPMRHGQSSGRSVESIG